VGPADSNPSGKVALCWLDILLVLLVIGCGLIFWSLSRRVVEWSHRDDKPLKQSFEQSANVPLRRAELGRASKEFETVQAKLTEEQMQVAGLDAEIEAEGQNPARSSSAVNADSARDRLFKRKAGLVMVGTLQRQAGEKWQSMLQSQSALSQAELTADRAYTQLLRHFEFHKRILGMSLGTATWVMLMALAWFGCGLARNRWGYGRRGFVLTVSVLFLLALCVYELLS
jgi:hypothetical protein